MTTSDGGAASIAEMKQLAAQRSVWVGMDLMAGAEADALVAAAEQDNPEARVERFPGYLILEAPHQLTIKRPSVEEYLGRPWNTRDLHVIMSSYHGEIGAWDEDTVTLRWSK